MRIYYCQDNQKIRFYDKELQKLDIFDKFCCIYARGVQEILFP